MLARTLRPASALRNTQGRLIIRKFSEATKIEHHPDPLHGSYHWLYERALSVATLGAVTTAFLLPSKPVDLALGILLPLHSHIGFGAIITDYLPARKFPRVYMVSRSLLYVATAGAIYGLYEYNTRDVGICEGVRSLWHAKNGHDTDD